LPIAKVAASYFGPAGQAASLMLRIGMDVASELARRVVMIAGRQNFRNAGSANRWRNLDDNRFAPDLFQRFYDDGVVWAFEV
jgi:hypothetical protein